MGGVPKLCMNILMFPEQLPTEFVRDILRGGYDKVAEAGAIIVGGHTIKDDIPKYGLCVSGIVHPDKILRNNSIQMGDVLILTKPVGTGVLSNADKGGLLTLQEHKTMVACMATLNKYAAEVALTFDGIHACTDVTGFSLLGHSYEMCSQTGLSIVITASSVPFLTGAMEYASMGLVPAMAYQNMEHLTEKVFLSPSVPQCVRDLLFDPQTSGGLLYSVAPDQSERFLEALKKVSESAAIIGHVEPSAECPVLVI